MARIQVAALGAVGVWCLSTRVLAQEPPPSTPPQETPQSDRETPAPARGAASVTAPEVIVSAPAEYPARALAENREATVDLHVTVRIDGSVGDVEVVESGGADFDEAAIHAVKMWRFKPATRGGDPVASRIHIPFRFSLPHEHLEHAPPPVSLPPTTPHGRADHPEIGESPAVEGTAKPLAQAGTSKADSVSPGQPITEITVEGEREAARTETRSTSDFTVERDIVAAAPRREGADALATAPGLFIRRSEGLAVAHRYSLRGFDADHGQDIEFRVGGLPINLPSHVHGQGYSDLGFLISPVVAEIRASEGVYDPRQGDFAVAGTIDVNLGVASRDRGIQLRAGYGSFDTYEQTFVWAPRDAEDASFGAARYVSTDGFGENRSGKSGSALVQHRFGEGSVRYRVIALGYAARADSAGVVRADDVDAGRVCFDCVYPYPTARAQNAMSQRFMSGFFGEYHGERGENGEYGVFVGYDDFRIQENFTGFIESSRTLERVAGRGDLIEQRNRTLTLGLTGRHRTTVFEPTPWARGTVELGIDGRFDTIEQAQSLLDAAVRLQTWDQRVDAEVRAADLGMWGDLDMDFARLVRFRLGFRGDLLSYDVDDRLGNFVPATRSDDAFIQGFRRSAAGVAAGPRTSLEVRPLPWLSVLGAYGEGFRSPAARSLEEGEESPFTKVRSADAGVRFDWGDPLRLTVGGYYTHLSDDVAFDANEGRLERIGATRRLGTVAYFLSRPVPWFVNALSITYVDATLLEPPPPTADDPNPPFTEGENLPFVPPVVVRADLGVRHILMPALGPEPLGGRAGLGFSYLSPRPLPYGQSSAPVALLDASVGAEWGPLDLSLEVFNVFDDQYAAVEYNFASDWNPNDGLRSRTPARHISAGAPRSYMVFLGVTL